MATDIFRPATTSATPVVVTRTAYDRSSHLAEGLGWARQGIAYVVQDVRGRYGSDGTWTPYRHERADGATLADWILAQPWCDGRLVAMGGSYAACTAWSLAVERPRSVAGVVSLGAALGMRAVKYDRAGILRLAEHAAWWAERAESRTSRTGLAAAMFAGQPGLLNHLPVVEIPRRMWSHLTRWTDVLDDPDDDLIEADLAESPVASLHVGGWYDLLGPDTLRHWEVVGVRRSPRRPSRTLVLGPWGHDLAWSPDTKVGCRDSGEAGRLALGPLIVGWVEAVLAEKTPDQPPTQVFVIGANRWWTGPCWPPADLNASRWHTAAGGRLAGEDPGERVPVHYRYDPSDPFPSADPGADRASLSVREDAVRFTSEPLPASLTIMGRPIVHLDASSTRPSTDFVVRLNECKPDGQILELTRAALDAEASGPGPWQLTLDPIAATAAAGTRLQLEITSSDFPYLVRNLNTGADRYRTAAAATALQTIHTGSTTLILPVTPRPVEAEVETT